MKVHNEQVCPNIGNAQECDETQGYYEERQDCTSFRHNRIYPSWNNPTKPFTLRDTALRSRAG